MDRVRAGRHNKTGLALAVMLAAGAGRASAHPHVWVTVESVVLYEQGSITAIRHTWTFDEMYTTMAIQGLDTNNDGKYDRKELSELAKVNMEGLREFAYFTQVRLADETLMTAEPLDYYLEYGEVAQSQSEPQPTPPAAGADNKGAKPAGASRSRETKAKSAPKPKVLSLHFTLPLKQPVRAELPGFSFTVSDPTFFIAFELAKDHPVKLGPGAPSACRVAIGATQRGAQDPNRPSGSFSTEMGAQGYDLGFPKPIAITCASKS